MFGYENITPVGLYYKGEHFFHNVLRACAYKDCTIGNFIFSQKKSRLCINVLEENQLVTYIILKSYYGKMNFYLKKPKPTWNSCIKQQVFSLQ